jgi:hypothetical protein
MWYLRKDMAVAKRPALGIGHGLRLVFQLKFPVIRLIDVVALACKPL